MPLGERWAGEQQEYRNQQQEEPAIIGHLATPRLASASKANAELPLRQLGGLGVLRSVWDGVAEEARTRGFATPAFAGYALVDGVAD